jgi:serine/threonine protein kinase
MVILKSKLSSQDITEIIKDAVKVNSDIQGSHSVVFRSKDLKYSIKVISKVQVKPLTITDMKKTIGWCELYFLQKVSGSSINFPTLSGWYYSKQKESLYIISEWEEGLTMYQYLKDYRPFCDLRSLFLQVLFLLNKLYRVHNIVHGDCIPQNILLKKIKYEKGTYFCYVVNGEKYYIENMGYVPVLWDYGFSVQNITSESPIKYDGVNIANYLNVLPEFVDIYNLSRSLSPECNLFEANKYFYDYLLVILKGISKGKNVDYGPKNSFEKGLEFLLFEQDKNVLTIE